MGIFSKNNGKNFQRTSARNFLENSQKKKKKKKNVKNKKKKKYSSDRVFGKKF